MKSYRQLREEIIKPTRVEVQRHFDGQTGSQRSRILSTERALMVRDIVVSNDGTVVSYKFDKPTHR
jgi:hypothetical protein